MSNFGAGDMVSALRRVLMKRPGEAMAQANPQTWHYSGPLEKEKLCADHDRLVAIIENFGSEVVFLEQDPSELADAVFTHDGTDLPILGRISMDMIALDLGKNPELGEGDWVVLPYDLPEAASRTGLSQYELLTLLGNRFEHALT